MWKHTQLKKILDNLKREQPTISNKNDVTLYETVITRDQNSERILLERLKIVKTERGRAEWSSYKERRVDALALRADERRDKLR